MSSPSGGGETLVDRQKLIIADAERRIKLLETELQAVYAAYPWDHGKGESAGSLMKSAVEEARFQKDRFKARGGELDQMEENCKFRIRQRDEKGKQLRKIREAAEAYEKDPINMSDKFSSWQKLSNLIKLALGESK